MKKRVLRMMATGLVGCMLMGTAAGCGNSGTSNTSSSSVASDSGTEKDEKSSDDIVTLKWIQIGNGQPDNYDAWQAHINEYLADKIGVNIDVEIISWGDWEKRRSTIINTGEDYDIIFSNDVVYESDVRLGAYYDITDLLDANCPDVKSLIPEDYWDAVSVDGKIYGIPTYKDSSITQYFVWDKDLCDKLGLDVTNLTELDQLTDAFDTIYKETNQPVTYRASDAPCQFLCISPLSSHFYFVIPAISLFLILVCCVDLSLYFLNDIIKSCCTHLAHHFRNSFFWINCTCVNLTLISVVNLCTVCQLIFKLCCIDRN
jgi:putative aldouronate transport system substrate-binding protein